MSLAPNLIPHPHTKSMLLDGVFLLFIATIQITIFPSIMEHSCYVDFLTPWLTYVFIEQTFAEAFWLILLGATALEMHTTVPSGTYLTAYGTIAAWTFLLRKHITWRRPISWVVTYAVTQLWLSGFELFVIYVREGLWMIDEGEMTALGFDLLMSLVFGLMAFEYKQALLKKETTL